MAKRRKSATLDKNKRKIALLNKLYYAIAKPTGLSSERRLLDAAQKINPSINNKDVKLFLAGQDAHTLHKVTPKHFRRRKILSPKPKVIISADLADMTKLSKQNYGYRYIVVFIDVFSRYLAAYPLKRKNAESVYQALEKVVASKKFEGFTRLFVDRGGEFYNNKVTRYCQNKNITLYSVSSYEIKASIAERVIQTLKRKIYKYLTANNTKTYITVLPRLVESYNNSPHTSLGKGKTPHSVHNLRERKEISDQFYSMYKKGMRSRKTISSDLSAGDTVRIANKDKQSLFRKGYNIQNTEEIFKIKQIDDSQTPTIFYLCDLAGEKVDGIFYRSELIKTLLPDHFPIRILKKKVVRGKNQYLVHWIGYPKSFDSWVNDSDLKGITKPITIP